MYEVLAEINVNHGMCSSVYTYFWCFTFCTGLVDFFFFVSQKVFVWNSLSKKRKGFFSNYSEFEYTFFVDTMEERFCTF